MAAFSPELSAVWKNMEKIKALATRNIQAMRDETVFLSPFNRPYGYRRLFLELSITCNREYDYSNDTFFFLYLWNPN